MPLYEAVVIARSFSRGFGLSSHVATDKESHARLLRFVATYVLDNNGVVRKFINLGKNQLPYRMKRHQQIFEQGQYFAIQFDSSPAIMQSLSRALSLNEHVIRHTMIKTGDSLKTITSHVAPERL